MGTQSLQIRPGVNKQATPLLNEGGWSYSAFIRFRDGLVEKMRGWVRFVSEELIGVCRFMLAWQSLSGIPYLAFGTNRRLQVFAYGQLYDITPLEDTDDITPKFSTTNGQTLVTIEHTAHPGLEGESIFIVTPISVGGIILYGYYAIVTLLDVDNYTITAADAATATVVDGGATPEYTTINMSPEVATLFEDHGMAAGEIWTVNVSTVVGGLTLLGDYIISAVVDADNFSFTANADASSGATVSENTGDARINYLIAAGLVDAQPIQGYGIGGYGEGLYGFGDDSGSNAPPRHWSGMAWGEDGIFSPTNGGIYLWDSSIGVINNPAAIIAGAPLYNTQILLAMPQQQVIALGSEDSGVQDPLLIKWSHVRDYTKWRDIGTAFDPASQAGFFRIPRGGKIVGGEVTPHQIMVWTDVSAWLMQYIKPPLLYGFDEVGPGAGLIGPRAKGVIGGRVIWMSKQGIYLYNGASVVLIPCPVWDEFFDNLDQEQAYKIECKVNSQEGEISFCGPSLLTSENDMEIKLRINDGFWDYTRDTDLNKVGRTAWLDWSIWGQPMGVKADGTVCQHEIGFNDLESPLVASVRSGWFLLTEGAYFINIRRLFPDFKLSDGATLYINIYYKNSDNEDEPERVRGPFAITSATKFVKVKGRGVLASIEIYSTDEDVSWRMGRLRYLGQPAGRR